MKLYLLVFLSSLFILSCTKKKQTEYNIDFSFEKLCKSTLSEAISSYSIVKLETNKDSKINIIKKGIIKNDRIYLLNHQESKQEILIFSMSGDYINKISRKDEGDNEFQSIVDFDLHPVNGQINLLDQKQRKVVAFDENTDFVETYKINYPAKEIAFGMKGGKVFTVFRIEYQEENVNSGYEIITYDENNKLANTFFPFRAEINKVQSHVRTLMKRKGKVMFLREGTNHLYEIDLKRCRKSSNFIFPKPVLPAEKVYAAFFKGEVDLTNYIYNVDYFESGTILYTTFSSTDGNYIGIYNKKAGNSSLYNMLLDPKCKCGIKIDIIGSFNNYFIVQIPRTKISSVMNVLDNTRTKCINEEMAGIIDNMKPGENPILLLLEIQF